MNGIEGNPPILTKKHQIRINPEKKNHNFKTKMFLKSHEPEFSPISMKASEKRIFYIHFALVYVYQISSVPSAN